MNDVQTERTWKQQRFPDNIYILQAKFAYQFGRAVKGNHLLILSARHQLTTENWLLFTITKKYRVDRNGQPEFLIHPKVITELE